MGFCNANKYWWLRQEEIHFLPCNLQNRSVCREPSTREHALNCPEGTWKILARDSPGMWSPTKRLNMDMICCSRRGYALLQRDPDESEEAQVTNFKSANIIITIMDIMTKSESESMPSWSRNAQTMLERMQMVASDSINSVVENFFGGSRWLALMVTSRIVSWKNADSRWRRCWGCSSPSLLLLVLPPTFSASTVTRLRWWTPRSLMSPSQPFATWTKLQSSPSFAVLIKKCSDPAGGSTPAGEGADVHWWLHRLRGGELLWRQPQACSHGAVEKILSGWKSRHSL